VHLRVERVAEPVAHGGQPQPGQQLSEGWFGLGTAASAGTGLGLDHFAGKIPELTST
jgi:hypothetical protein